ncbi:heat shock protein HslVU, ATPase subunit HslU, partial [Reticulomyxa filosa]
YETELKGIVDAMLLKSLTMKLSEVEIKEKGITQERLEKGELDEMEVSVDVPKELDLNKTYRVKRARDILMEQELRKRLNENDLITQAVELAQNDGVVFIDEIDKICSSRNSFRGGDRKVSQEGVQRDLLPLIEGCSVQVPGYGKVDTDHILFICAGAFHDSKPSDLMPEFQVSIFFFFKKKKKKRGIISKIFFFF